MNRIGLAVLLLTGIVMMGGCAAPQVKLFSDASDPLKESILQGTEKGKVLVVTLQGVISTRPREGTLRTMPSMVQEVISQLRMAEKDPEIKCLLLKVDSPGGTATASDILYNEILAFKERTQAKIVVSMMDIAASGGYYVSLPADIIFAHPTNPHRSAPGARPRHQRRLRWQARTLRRSCSARCSGVTTGVLAGRWLRSSASGTRRMTGVGLVSQSYQRP